MGKQRGRGADTNGVRPETGERGAGVARKRGKLDRRGSWRDDRRQERDVAAVPAVRSYVLLKGPTRGASRAV